ncbi:MAG: hypothetical protein IKL88_00310, partial [Erysipelotrichales bacterium]|nr:hypothetical protein [Erysipelotrichales bacterium]
VEGDYFNDFDLYVAPRESEDYIVYEFRNGNEVYFDDTVIYITEPISNDQYSILYLDPINVMETLEIQREDIVDCIIYDSNIGGSEKIGSVINKEDFNEFLDEIYTLEMYDVFPLTVGIGSAGYDIEFVLKDGTTYRMRNDSLVLNIYKNNEIYIEDHTGAFYINTIIQKYGYQER